MNLGMGQGKWGGGIDKDRKETREVGEWPDCTLQMYYNCQRSNLKNTTLFDKHEFIFSKAFTM